MGWCQLTRQVEGNGGGGWLGGVGIGGRAGEASAQVSAGQWLQGQLILDGACRGKVGVRLVGVIKQLLPLVPDDSRRGPAWRRDEEALIGEGLGRGWVDRGD